MAENLAGLVEETMAALPLHAVRPAGLPAMLAALPAAARQAALTSFKAEAGTILLFPGPDGSLAGALLGLGDKPALQGFGAAAGCLPPGSVWRLADDMADPEDAALGFLLGAYRYTQFKARPTPPARLRATSVPARARILAASITLTRDLINTPANVLGPGELAEAALALAARHGAQATHITGAALTERYPAMAAVGAGADRPPHAVLLEWRGRGADATAPLISLCGKGVCFDTGGYDLKPSSAMLRMKKDMGGAAIILGLAQAVMSLDLPLRLQVRIGCVENSVSGHAMRPSDILRSRSGLTVEVGNTDAEGRLVLCDLLAEAASATPDWLIDVATLTGAARVALGPDLPALFCTDDAMADMILRAGLAAGDPLWRLPLHDAYTSWLDSPMADLNNVSAKPFAGAIIAALFLRHFVSSDIRWAHIDTYAWNDSNRPGQPEGGEAQSLRALLGAFDIFCNKNLQE